MFSDGLAKDSPNFAVQPGRHHTAVSRATRPARAFHRVVGIGLKETCVAQQNSATRGKASRAFQRPESRMRPPFRIRAGHSGSPFPCCWCRRAADVRAAARQDPHSFRRMRAGVQNQPASLPPAHVQCRASFGASQRLGSRPWGANIFRRLEPR